MEPLTPTQGIILAVFIVLVTIYISFSYIIFMEMLNIKRIWIKRIISLFSSILVGFLLSCFMAWLFKLVLDKINILLF